MGKQQGIETELLLVGKKGEQWFGKRAIPIGGRFVLGNTPSPATGSELSNLLVAKFISGEIDAAELIYTRFNSLISSEPSIRTLLPLSLSGIEEETDEVFMMTTKDGKMVLKKDAPAEVLNTMLTLYFAATVMRCLQESVASELANRMTAMQSASTNAKKITQVLSQIYNRARQATVTAEILEISAGAAALAD